MQIVCFFSDKNFTFLSRAKQLLKIIAVCIINLVQVSACRKGVGADE